MPLSQTFNFGRSVCRYSEDCLIWVVDCFSLFSLVGRWWLFALLAWFVLICIPLFGLNLSFAVAFSISRGRASRNPSGTSRYSLLHMNFFKKRKMQWSRLIDQSASMFLNTLHTLRYWKTLKESKKLDTSLDSGQFVSANRCYLHYQRGSLVVCETNRLTNLIMFKIFAPS